MFGFISNKSLRREAEALVNAFARSCPPPEKLGDKHLVDSKVRESLQIFYAEVKSYARKNRLGVIGRARLAKALQEETQRQGYPGELANRLVNAVTINALITRADD